MNGVIGGVELLLADATSLTGEQRELLGLFCLDRPIKCVFFKPPSVFLVELFEAAAKVSACGLMKGSVGLGEDAILPFGHAAEIDLVIRKGGLVFKKLRVKKFILDQCFKRDQQCIPGKR